MAHSHFSTLGPYSRDPVCELQRLHREREAKAARQERAEQWLAERLVGQTFTSYESMMTAACRTLVTVKGRALTPDEHELISNAVRALFSGICFRATLAAVNVRTVRENGAVTFTRAA